MEYVQATREDLEQVYTLVQETITAVYPKYYPTEVVNFFSGHHSKEKILKDIEKQCLWLLYDDGMPVGTGSCQDNYVNRVYVSPTNQKKGYGSYIMQALEREIALKDDYAYLDASLPAVCFYENRGYISRKHEKTILENGVVLVYEVMEKQFVD